MKLPRRRFLQLAAGAAVLPTVTRITRAQTYPSRPVRIVVGYSAGTSDIVVRLIAQWLSERLGQRFIIENRPGAATNIATAAVVRAPADGYLLLAATSANTINAALYDNLGFDFMRDIAMIAGVARQPLFLEVHPELPVNTVSEFIAYARANPRKISIASFGTGTISHVACELFKMMAGLDMIHVPYHGGAPAVLDLISGRVQAMFVGEASSIEHIKTGKLRPLAVTSATRSRTLPDIPTVAEILPGFEATGWYAVGAPKSTPAEIVDRLNVEINAGLSDPKIRERLADLGSETFAGSPADLDNFVAAETGKWGKVVRAAHIKTE